MRKNLDKVYVVCALNILYLANATFRIVKIKSFKDKNKIIWFVIFQFDYKHYISQLT